MKKKIYDTSHNEKKPTRDELLRRMQSSIVFVPKDRETKSMYFDDKGVRLTVTEDYCVIATGAHQHVFDKLTVAGVSRPYLYVSRFIDIALGCDCMTRDGKGNMTRSYAKLFAILKEKEDKNEYNICWYIDLWLNNIFAPLYSIDESETASFLVYEQYIHNIARQQAILEEHKEDVTNIQFVGKVVENMGRYIEGIPESVLFRKRTDDEVIQENVSAMEQAMTDDVMANGKGES